MLISKEFATEFAREWIEAWNAHDLKRILSHYSDEFEMNSLVIVNRLGKEDGRLVGKKAVGEYWAAALIAFPNLKFELKTIFTGPRSVTLLYVGASGGYVTETFVFGDDLHVVQAYANYE